MLRSAVVRLASRARVAGGCQLLVNVGQTSHVAPIALVRAVPSEIPTKIANLQRSLSTVRDHLSTSGVEGPLGPLHRTVVMAETTSEATKPQELNAPLVKEKVLKAVGAWERMPKDKQVSNQRQSVRHYGGKPPLTIAAINDRLMLVCKLFDKIDQNKASSSRCFCGDSGAFTPGPRKQCAILASLMKS